MAAQGNELTNSDPRGDLRTIHRAADLYYNQSATQLEIATQLNVSRPTVSRLLAEARRVGIVRIQVIDPYVHESQSLSVELAQKLGVDRCYVQPNIDTKNPGADVAHVMDEIFSDAGLRAGSVVLVASGLMVYSIGQQNLPSAPGVVFVPTVGGQSEPEAWHQANEIARTWAQATHGQPSFIHAQALPSAAMHEILSADGEFMRTQRLWASAELAIVGVGAPPSRRESISRSIPANDSSLASAAGDVCLHFFDEAGAPVEFAGSDRLIHVPLHVLRALPLCVAAAAGPEKVVSIVAAARGGYFNRLITDDATARAILLYLESADRL